MILVNNKLDMNKEESQMGICVSWNLFETSRRVTLNCTLSATYWNFITKAISLLKQYLLRATRFELKKLTALRIWKENVFVYLKMATYSPEERGKLRNISLKAASTLGEIRSYITATLLHQST
jgi:hypothetical protein